MQARQHLHAERVSKNKMFKLLISRKEIIVNICTGLLVLLFAYAAASKWVKFDKFYGELNSQPFPNWTTPYLVWLIPGVEILIAIGLIFERTRRISFIASLILIVSFTVYVGLILLNVFERIPCSCGGVLQKLGWQEHFWFNIIFVFISFLGLKLGKSRV